MEEKRFIRRGHTIQLNLELSKSYENNKILLNRERLISGIVAFQLKVIVLRNPTTEGTQGYYDFGVLVHIRFRKVFLSDNLTYTAKISSDNFNLFINSITFSSNTTSWSQIYECALNRAISIQFSMDLTVELELKSKSGFLAYLHNDIIMDLTDFELCCKDGSVHVHKVILAGYSPVLQKLVTGDWREAKEGRVNIEGTTTKTLQDLKDYMYNDKLPDNGLKQLMVLASYYLMEDLEQKCSFKILKSLSVENGLELAEFAAKYGMRYLFLAVIKTAQRSTDYVEQMEKSLVKNSVDSKNNNKEDNLVFDEITLN